MRLSESVERSMERYLHQKNGRQAFNFGYSEPRQPYDSKALKAITGDLQIAR